MKKNSPCYESAVKRNLRSLFDRNEPGALAFLFCQRILRAFIENRYSSGWEIFSALLTYHRSLVVDRSSIQALSSKPYQVWCNERGTFTSVGSKPQAVGRQSWASSIGVQSWEKGSVRLMGAVPRNASRLVMQYTERHPRLCMRYSVTEP